MNYYWVYQNKTFEYEREGEYLWAPKKTKNGKQTQHHWTRMKEVKKGDIIFHSLNRQIVCISIAKDKCIESNRPDKFDDTWEREGWLLKTDYYELKPYFDYSRYADNIYDLQPEKYGPLDKNGRGNMGYLFQANEEVADYLISLIKKEQTDEDIINLLNGLETNSKKSISKKIENNIPNNIETTERDQIVKSRIGQGSFRKKLEANGSSCKICGLNKNKLLIASHIKPWSESADEERLDENNGFLFCPNHDALFDKGYISFDNKGRIIISSELNESIYNSLNIDNDLQIDINKENIKYLEWHRENIFLSSK